MTLFAYARMFPVSCMQLQINRVGLECSIWLNMSKDILIMTYHRASVKLDCLKGMLPNLQPYTCCQIHNIDLL